MIPIIAHSSLALPYPLFNIFSSYFWFIFLAILPLSSIVRFSLTLSYLFSSIYRSSLALRYLLLVLCSLLFAPLSIARSLISLVIYSLLIAPRSFIIRSSLCLLPLSFLVLFVRSSLYSLRSFIKFIIGIIVNLLAHLSFAFRYSY